MIRTAMDLLDALPKTWLYTFDEGAKVARLGGEPNFMFADMPGPDYDQDRDRALQAYWRSFLERDELPPCILAACTAVRVSVDSGGTQG